MLAISILLFWLGLCFASFVNALVWRIHEKKDFTRARSQCPNCNHILAPKDLVPVFSWLMLKGKCRYCQQSISRQYPVVELTGAFIFAWSYLFWPMDLSQTGNIVLFVTWLASSVGLLALAVYDLKWMLLPSKILYPTLLTAVGGEVVYLVGFAPDKLHFSLTWLASVVVASGIFFTLFTVSKGKWIGYGDVRLGLITGTLLHTPGKSALMIFLASLIGSLAVLPLLAVGKKNLSAKMPYGPFLIIATFICLIYGDGLIHWYKNLILP
jgi:leader peptidase (prepilin peptidase) / N-methyltransferase